MWQLNAYEIKEKSFTSWHGVTENSWKLCMINFECQVIFDGFII